MIIYRYTHKPMSGTIVYLISLISILDRLMAFHTHFASIASHIVLWTNQTTLRNIPISLSFICCKSCNFGSICATQIPNQECCCQLHELWSINYPLIWTNDLDISPLSTPPPPQSPPNQQQDENSLSAKNARNFPIWNLTAGKASN